MLFDAKPYPQLLHAQHNSRQHFDSADWAMSKASSSAAASDAAPAASRGQPSDARTADSNPSATGAPASSADRLPSRFQRSPVAERTLSRLSQS